MQPQIKTDIEARVQDIGDTMTGDLILNHGTYPRIALNSEDNNSCTFVEGSANKISLQTSQMPFGNSGDNRRIFNLSNKGYSENVKDCLYLSDRIDGVTTNYLIYGEHNKPTPTELGTIPIINVTGDGNDANNLYVSDQTVLYHIKTTTVANMPTTNHGFLLSTTISQKKQVWFPDSSNHIYGRNKEGNWQQITASDSGSLPLTGGTLTGQIKINRAGSSWIGVIDSPEVNYIYADHSSATSSIYHSMVALRYANHTFSLGGERASEQFGIYAYNNTRTVNGQDAGFYVANDLNFYCSTRMYGAVWNDYAEYRIYPEEEIPYGRCVVEVGDDSMRLANERLMPGAKICSDTFGFAIGETEECNMPIAVSGRVLAYPYEGREEFAKNIGKPVCSGPNGTVSIMSDEEYKEKGYCCVGTISAIPNYEVWGTGNVNVNGRVWISV